MPASGRIARRIMLSRRWRSRSPTGAGSCSKRPCACSRARDSTQRGSATSPRRPASPTACSTTTSARRKRCSRRSSARPGGCSSPRRSASSTSGVPLREQLRRFARIYLGSWLVTPDLDSRARARDRAQPGGRRPGRRDPRPCSSRSQRIIEAAQERGEVRADCDAALAAWIVYGALEEILTGLGARPAAGSTTRTSSARSRRSSRSRHAGLAA